MGGGAVIRRRLIRKINGEGQEAEENKSLDGEKEVSEQWSSSGMKNQRVTQSEAESDDDDG